jgi:hypothetical protein
MIPGLQSLDKLVPKTQVALPRCSLTLSMNEQLHQELDIDNNSSLIYLVVYVNDVIIYISSCYLYVDVMCFF